MKTALCLSVLALSLGQSTRVDAGRWTHDTVKDEMTGAVRRKAFDLDSSNTQWHHDLSVGHRNMAIALNAQGDTSGFVHHLRQAVQIHERLAARFPRFAVERDAFAEELKAALATYGKD